MSKIMARVTESSPKAKRLSTVALTGAALAMIWAIIHAYIVADVDPVVVSSTTSLALMLAGFWDFKHSDSDTYRPNGGDRDGSDT